MKIPDWLSHLRVDERGRPVPYINRWGAESADRLSIRFDPNVGMPGVFDDDSAETVPDFTAQNMGRQREVMTVGLCQVCARPVPWSRRFLVVSSMSVEEVVVQELRRKAVVVTEPWLDERCAQFAISKCPGLIRRSRGEDLHLVRVLKAAATLLVSRGWVEGPLEAESRELMPAMWSKVAVKGLAIEKAAA